jgi:hypothetical protein
LGLICELRFLAQQVRQLGDIRRNAPRLIFAEQLGARHRPQRQGQAHRVETNLDQLIARLLA